MDDIRSKTIFSIKSWGQGGFTTKLYVAVAGFGDRKWEVIPIDEANAEAMVAGSPLRREMLDLSDTLVAQIQFLPRSIA
ncbi:MAG: hypothetical protein KBC81_00950 [Candidatus Pacebacteria bacterium]|nr:hypothetical protein [Candidatus Paceibacterota bacterium]